MSGDIYQVKGSSIRSKLDYTETVLGADAASALESWLRERGLWPVLEATWYPFEDYDAVLQFMVERFFDGDAKRLYDVGRFSGRRALTTTYDVFRRQEFRDFHAKLPILHSRHYSHGQVIAPLLQDDADRCPIRLVGAPTYPDTDLYVSAGFYASAAQLMGCDDVRCAFERIGDEARLLLTWAKPG